MHPEPTVDTRAGDTQHDPQVDAGPLHTCEGDIWLRIRGGAVGGSSLVPRRSGHETREEVLEVVSISKLQP